MSISLPPEALDRVVDFLHDDRKALSGCSLASPLLTPTARHHVFSELALAPTEINSFLELIDAPWCTVPPAIQSIAIEQRPSRQREQEAQGFYVPNDFPRMVQRLGGIQSIRFEGVDLSDISPPFMRAFYQASKVQKVVLADVTVYTLEPLLRYLTSLSCLRSLSVSGLKNKGDEQSEYPASISKFRISLLDGGSSSTEILHWIKAQLFVPVTDVFRINIDASPSEAALVAEYARHLGDTVDEIMVKWPADQYNVAYTDYSLFPNVKSMHLQVGLRLGYTSDLILAERHVRTIADQIDSPYFDKMTLEVVLLPVEFALNFLGILEHTAFQAFKWQGILDSVRERDIRHFTLIIRGLPECQRKPVEGFLQNVPFASLHRVGRIRVVCN